MLIYIRSNMAAVSACSDYGNQKDAKKNVDSSLRLRLLRYRQTPYDHLRVKAHAFYSASIQASTLDRLLKELAIFQETRT